MSDLFQTSSGLFFKVKVNAGGIIIVRAEGAMVIIVSAAADPLYRLPLRIFDCVLNYWH